MTPSDADIISRGSLAAAVAIPGDPGMTAFWEENISDGKMVGKCAKMVQTVYVVIFYVLQVQ